MHKIEYFTTYFMTLTITGLKKTDKTITVNKQIAAHIQTI